MILVLILMGGCVEDPGIGVLAQAERNDNPNPQDRAGCDEKPGGGCPLPDPQQTFDANQCHNVEYYWDHMLECWAAGMEVWDGLCDTTTPPSRPWDVPGEEVIDWSTCSGDRLPPYTCKSCGLFDGRSPDDPGRPNPSCTEVEGAGHPNPGFWPPQGIDFNRCWWGDTRYRDGSVIFPGGGPRPGPLDEHPQVPWFAPWTERQIEAADAPAPVLCVEWSGVNLCVSRQRVGDIESLRMYSFPRE